MLSSDYLLFVVVKECETEGENDVEGPSGPCSTVNKISVYMETR